MQEQQQPSVLISRMTGSGWMACTFSVTDFAVQQWLFELMYL